jgi:hypothetical protein
MCYALTVVSIVSVVRSMIMRITQGILRVLVCIVKYAQITTPIGVRIARILTQIITLVMRSQILVSIGARTVAKMVLTGAIVVSSIIVMSVVSARVVLE